VPLEVFKLEKGIRIASGLAIAGLTQWSANFAITMAFTIMPGSIGLVHMAFSLCAQEYRLFS